MRRLTCKKAKNRTTPVATRDASGFAKLNNTLRTGVSYRVGWIGTVLAGLGALLLAIRLFSDCLDTALGHMPASVQAGLALAGLVVNRLAWKGRIPPEHFMRFALAVEVLVAWAIATELLGWQDRVGASGWALGGTPSVGVWILFFAAIVPLRPREHLLGGVLSALSVPAMLALSLRLREEGAPEISAPLDTLAVQIGFPLVFALVISYLAARLTYGLSVKLSEAERMGSYRLRQSLGKGGMGEVWLADHEFLSRPAAIKFIRPDALASGAGAAEVVRVRFEREVQATAALHSPHTISVYDFGVTDDGNLYYVMEFLDGLSLEDLVLRHGPLPVDRVLHVLRQACHSLGEAHEAGLTHRDIKPANMFLCRSGRDVDHLKILDFGLVKHAETDANLTQEGNFTGTPNYAAPEAARGELAEVGPRTDIYALACVAYWLLSGKPVFEAETPIDALAAHLREDPEPVSRKGPRDVPEALDELLLQCLAKESEQRIPDADSLLRGLDALASAHPWSHDRAQAWWDEHMPVVRPTSEGKEALRQTPRR